MEIHSNKKRTPCTFAVGDHVLLKLQPYHQVSVHRRSSQKLAKRYFGPFQIKRKIGTVAYELELPASSWIHPVLHVSQLRPFYDKDTSQHSESIPPEFEPPAEEDEAYASNFFPVGQAERTNVEKENNAKEEDEGERRNVERERERDANKDRGTQEFHLCNSNLLTSKSDQKSPTGSQGNASPPFITPPTNIINFPPLDSTVLPRAFPSPKDSTSTLPQFSMPVSSNASSTRPKAFTCISHASPHRPVVSNLSPHVSKSLGVSGPMHYVSKPILEDKEDFGPVSSDKRPTRIKVKPKHLQDYVLN